MPRLNQDPPHPCSHSAWFLGVMSLAVLSAPWGQLYPLLGEASEDIPGLIYKVVPRATVYVSALVLLRLACQATEGGSHLLHVI